MIYILTGSIRTGKTTALKNWINSRNNVDGVLCPDNKNGKRYFLKVKSKEEFDFEVEFESEVENEELITIGNFKFLKSAFDEANNYLISISSIAEKKFIIIDEIGKLELKNEGLHLAVKSLISIFLNNENKHLILVVRDYLVNDVLRYYSIAEYRIVTKESLETLA